MFCSIVRIFSNANLFLDQLICCYNYLESYILYKPNQ